MAQATVMSQLTAENRAAEVDGETFVYRRFGADETALRRCCACSTSAATSTTGIRRWSTASPRVAK